MKINNLLNNNNNNRGKANWVWVVILVVIAAYFQWLLVGLHIETSRLAAEREQLRVELEEQTANIAQFQANFEASAKKAAENLGLILRDAKEAFVNNNHLNASDKAKR